MTVSMMESTKVRSRDRACAKRSMARSFVAFGAGGHVAAPRVFPLSLEQRRAARRFAIRRTVDAVVRHPCCSRGIGWILWWEQFFCLSQGPPTSGVRGGAARSRQIKARANGSRLYRQALAGPRAYHVKKLVPL